MALWLIRSGKHDGYESFLADKKIFFAWDGLDRHHSGGSVHDPGGRTATRR
jgi:hypothetical protein